MRELNGTGKEKLDNFDKTSTFTILDRAVQNPLEKTQGKLELKSFNTPYYLSWTYTLNDLNFKPNKYANCPRSQMTRIEHVS